MTELRCFCVRKPLLAICGTDTKTFQPFVHVKSMRKDNLNAEIVVTEGTVRIRCRDCYRWHTVRIIKNDLQVKQENLPETLAV